jgi:hypothetical protein
MEGVKTTNLKEATSTGKREEVILKKEAEK